MTEHHQGMALGLGGIGSSFVIWFLKNIQVIDGVMQFFLLAISIVIALVGARKAFKK